MKKNTFGDYIVFVDESGDQSLVSIDKQYPVFVLSFCIFEKKHYVEHVVPEILKLKFDFLARIFLYFMSVIFVKGLEFLTFL